MTSIGESIYASTILALEVKLELQLEKLSMPLYTILALEVKLGFQLENLSMLLLY